jgi:hypothetical protein
MPSFIELEDERVIRSKKELVEGPFLVALLDEAQVLLVALLDLARYWLMKYRQQQVPIDPLAEVQVDEIDHNILCVLELQAHGFLADVHVR